MQLPLRLPLRFPLRLPVFFIVMLLAVFTGCAQVPPIESGAMLWARGDFVALARQCAAASDADCRLHRAELALLENRPAAALADLDAALHIANETDDRRIRTLRAEARYRLGQFDAAARDLRANGRPAAATKLESFAGRAPYRLDAVTARTELPFLQTDPLPIVELTLVGTTGRATGRFIIDTGGSELILDPAFAARLGSPDFGAEVGAFAGSGKSALTHSAVNSVTLGEFTLHDVPVLLLDTKKFALVGGGHPVAGVLGTNVLYRFTATLDYPRSRLVLYTRFDAARDLPAGTPSVPMWLAGDHFILAKGRIGDAAEAMMFIDTGLAGPAFAAPESTLVEARIGKSARSYEGVSGAGTIQVWPVEAPSVELGPIRLAPVTGLAGAFPAALERRFGFRIGGLFSHGVLRRHAVTFDFLGMRLYLEQ